MTRDRNRKLAEMAHIAHGVRYGMAAFDDRREEMGPGIGARGNGRGGKGAHSSPTEAAVTKPAKVVTTNVERLVDAAHAALLDLDAAVREVAQPVHGLPTLGKPNCAWCDAAARAKDSPVPDHRCDTYLFAKVRRGGQDAKVLVCYWCFSFWRDNGREPKMAELWLHAQGRRVLVNAGRKPAMKAAKRMEATG